jgi:hypothetical protein
MYFQSDDQRYHVLAKLSIIALYVLLAFDLVMVVLGYFLAQSNTIESSGSRLIRDIVFGVAVADLIGIYLVRRYMLKKALEAPDGGADQNIVYSKLLNISMVIVLMCSAISTYGLVLVILGEKFETLLLFVAVSFIGYQFFRLRPRDFPDDHENTENQNV